jgi:hypothetical protein
METAKSMKKRKDEKAIQAKPSGMVSAEAGRGGPMITASQPKSSPMVKAILSKSLGEEKDANAVTEIDGEVVKWKAGKNPAYEERLMRLKKKAK